MEVILTGEQRKCPRCKAGKGTTIPLDCPKCNHQFCHECSVFAEESAGSSIKCPHCKTKLLITKIPKD